ncbi:MAG TPA: thioesterase family protein [Actinomycetes bacterium]
MRWSDMDAYGHVNNVRFLTYLEEARVEMIFNLTQDGAAADLSSGVVVARHEIDYLAPLVHRADPIPIDVWVTRIRAASFELAYEVHDEGRVYARAASTLVPFDLAQQRPRRLSASEREWLGQWLEPLA